MWVIFEVAAMIIFATLVISQVIIPLLMGTKVFPALRKRERELGKELEEVRQHNRESDLQEEIEEEKERKNWL